MSFKKKTASQKKKRASKSLFKFLKNRKSMGIALGVCLAVVASAYVATAKFSADSPQGELTPIESPSTMWIELRVINSKGDGVGGISIKNDLLDPNGESLLPTNYTKTFNTTDDGYTGGGPSLYATPLCRDKVGKIYICKIQTKNDKNQFIIPTFFAQIESPGSKPFTWKPQQIAKNLDDLNKRFNKNWEGIYYGSTIILKSDGLSGRIAANYEWVPTNQKINYAIKAFDKNGQPLSNAPIKLTLSLGPTIYRGWDPSTEEGWLASINSKTLDLTTDQNGSLKLNGIFLCKKGGQKKSCWAENTDIIPYPMHKSINLIKSITCELQDQKKENCFLGSNVKDKTVVLKALGSTTKMEGAAQNTGTVSQNQSSGSATTSTDIIKTLVIRVDPTWMAGNAGSVAVQLEGKKCNPKTEKTSGGCTPQVMKFDQACNGAGECILRFNVVNYPKVAKNGKKTDQFFLSPSADNDFLIKKIVVPSTSNASLASVSVPYPIGSTTKKAQSYTVNSGKQVSLKGKTAKTTTNTSTSTTASKPSETSATTIKDQNLSASNVSYSSNSSIKSGVLDTVKGWLGI